MKKELFKRTINGIKIKGKIFLKKENNSMFVSLSLLAYYIYEFFFFTFGSSKCNYAQSCHLYLEEKNWEKSINSHLYACIPIHND